MKQVVIKSGKAITLNITKPTVGFGEVLVRNEYSCISIGTELSSVNSSGQSFLERLKSNPELLSKGVNYFKNNGFKALLQKANAIADSFQATGYSSAGVVEKVGNGVKNIKVGDRVACAGAGLANHSELIRVPKNLVVKIPAGVSFKEASTVTMGAISLQGVRRLNPTLGEVVGVVGLGLLGQLTCQFLKTNGCMVVAFDPNSSRALEAEKEMGIKAFHSYDKYVSFLQNNTEGHGLDGVIITASSKSSDIISNAFETTRKKGRVVIVGDIGLKLKRSDFYSKEIDVLISTSYGPGRYDTLYEDEGLEYPLPYVRWTENRNMSHFLRLIDSGKVDIKRMNHVEFNLENSVLAYDEIQKNPPTLAFFKYSSKSQEQDLKIFNKTISTRKDEGIPRVSIVGSGGFAEAVHIPNLKSIQNITLSVVHGRDGLKLERLKTQHGFTEVTTSIDDINLNNTDIAIVTSRHHEHFSHVAELVQKGISVFVEKPTVLTDEELIELDLLVNKSSNAIKVLTGYNRRFAPLVREIKNELDKLEAPVIINYTMNAGYFHDNHWVHGKTGGGRNLGEACHIYDLFIFLLGTEVKSISVNAIDSNGSKFLQNDNFITTIVFESGSLATLTYTAMGSRDLSKERLEVFCNEGVIVMDDFESLKGYGYFKSLQSNTAQDKGHRNEILEFLNDVKENRWSISWEDQVLVNRIALAVEKEL